MLILASRSPRRSMLLQELSIPFTTAAADIKEWEDKDADPESLVLHNSREKALNVAANFTTANALILSADTTVALDGQVLNKPASPDEARVMLGRLSGREHQVYTGVCILDYRRHHKPDPEDCLLHCEISRVVFKKLTPSVIEQYITITHTLDKAGAYGIQENGELIVDHWEGSYTNIMGLPMEYVSQALLRFISHPGI